MLVMGGETGMVMVGRGGRVKDGLCMGGGGGLWWDNREGYGLKKRGVFFVGGKGGLWMVKMWKIMGRKGRVMVGKKGRVKAGKKGEELRGKGES